MSNSDKITNAYLHIIKAVIYPILYTAWAVKWAKKTIFRAVSRKAHKDAQNSLGCLKCSSPIDKYNYCSTCLKQPFPKNLKGNKVFDYLTYIYAQKAQHMVISGGHIYERGQVSHGEARKIIKLYLEDTKAHKSGVKTFNYKKLEKMAKNG